MAAGRHNLTRRALLGAGAALPVALPAPAAAEGSSPLPPFALSLSKGIPSLFGGEEGAGLRQPRIGSGAERGSFSSVSRAPWDRTVAAFRRAEAALAAFRAWEAALPAAARAFPACEPLEQRFSDLELGLS
jgi:hypothetical protein